VIKLHLSEKFVRVNVRYFQKRCALCFQGDKEHRADPEEARRVVCSRLDFTAPTGQAGQLLVVKLCADEAIAKVSCHAETTGSCTYAALQNLGITRVLSAALLFVVNEIIN